MKTARKHFFVIQVLLLEEIAWTSMVKRRKILKSYELFLRIRR